MMKYEAVKKQFVFETLGKGIDVIVCDFPALKMIKASDINIKALQGYMDKEETVFYKAVRDND